MAQTKHKATVVKNCEGHKLTPKEAKFIDKYLETGNGQRSVIEAGYKTKAPHNYANELLRKQHIKVEIAHRLDSLKKESIATADEVMQYLTSVMRGEVTDQFGLEAPLSERTKAAQELAKRTIDIVNKVKDKDDQLVVTIVRRKDLDKK